MLTLARSSRLLPAALIAVMAAVVFQLTRWYLTGVVVPVQVAILALGLCLLLVRPKPFVYLLLFLTYVVPQTIAFSFGGVSSDLGELIAYALVASWGLQRVIHRHGRPVAYGKPFALLALAITFGVVVGVSRSAESFLMRGETKAYLLYFLVLPLTAITRSERDRRRLERWVVATATVGAAYVLLLLAFGQVLYAGGDFNTLGIEAHAQRIKPPVLELAVVALMLILARILSEGATLLRLAQVGLLITLFGFSFYRGTWIGLMLGVLLLTAVAPGKQRARRAFRIGLVTALLGSLLVSLSSGGHLGPSAQAMTQRAASIFSPQISHDSSFVDRANESELAVKALEGSPLFGVGIAATYGATITRYDPGTGTYYAESRPFSHNSYLQLYLQLGLLGLLALGLLVRGTVQQLRRARREDAVRAAGVSAALVAIAFKAVLNTQLLERPAIVALAVALALAHAGTSSRADS